MTRLLNNAYRIASLAIFVVCMTSCSHTNKTNWQSLFDGSSTSGWTQSGEAIWSVNNGELAVLPSEPNGYLVTERTFANFQLTLEFWPDAQVNSGVFIRCPDNKKIAAGTCYEMNIWDNHPNQSYRTGAIVKYQKPLAQVNTIGKWNRYEITAVDNVITVKINGVVTGQLKDDYLNQGYIALQRFNGGLIKFRNIKIKEI
ncbi:DUF1080 domain-containing protein [bacterium SCSIO 12696]|nr:DUF1080 domain-containing protein [bacterium SCSIO 12696]